MTMFLFISYLGYSQDIIVLRNGEQIDCKITKIDSSYIFYDFYKGERKLSSYLLMNEIKSYMITDDNDSVQDTSNASLLLNSAPVVIDTLKYIRETSKWINLITYSQRYGIHAKGWSVQYYGYNVTNKTKWSFPLQFGIEIFDIYIDYFSRFNYQMAEMSYFLAGISPFYRLNDNFFLNLGINIVFGEEKLTDFYGGESSDIFFGLSPSQGIHFIPTSKVGLTLGVSVYEKLLTSEVFKNDIGLEFELGIKF